MTRRDRVRILLQSYQDVVELPESHDGGPASGPSSRLLSRSVNPLWSAGSYPALERCLTRLRAFAPSLYWHLTAFYWPPDGSRRVKTVDGRSVPVEVQKQKAERGLDLLVRWMPRNVYVPQSFSEGDGVNVTEAQAAERPRRRLHAA